MQGDEQEPDTRCGTFGTSGHVTTKSSIHGEDLLYKSGVYASKVYVSYPGRPVRCQTEGKAEGPNGFQMELNERISRTGLYEHNAVKTIVAVPVC